MLKLNQQFAKLIAKELKKELEPQQEPPWFVRRPWIYLEMVGVGVIAGWLANHLPF